MKYVTGANDAHHCTNVLRGRYSKKLSKHRAGVGEQGLGASIVCDEQPAGSFAALYVCGVAQKGYRQPLAPIPGLRGTRPSVASGRPNYPHNLHLPILPAPGKTSEFAFEEWCFTIRNGVVLPIPSEAELPERYRSLPPEYTTCRIFRWAVCWNGFES